MANKNKQNKTGNPAPTSSAPSTEIDSNERRRVLSAIILERLQKQDVVWVRIADPDAIRADDLLIATKSRIDGYLIKWSEWADTLSLEDLTSDQSGEGSLVKQLADGWTRLKKQYRLPITVHLLTNDQPSARRIKDSKKSDCHLAKFLAHEWKKNEQDNADWSTLWAEIQAASGLSPSRFSEFVDACKFDCSYSKPAIDEDADEYHPYYWVEHIYDTLFEHEDHTLPIELNHAELLQLLGWRREQSRQILKLPKDNYQSISQHDTEADTDLYSGVANKSAQDNSTERLENPFDRDDESGATEPSGESFPATSNETIEEGLSHEGSTAGSKPQPSLSSLRGASAAWLQAASDSDSETADWLKAGAPPAGTTAGGGTFFGGNAPAANFQTNEISPEVGELSGEVQNRSSLSTSLHGKKIARDKPSWKDLAEKNRDAPGPRKFGEPTESKTDSAESQRITGRLRQMMSSIKTEAPEETEEDEDYEGRERPHSDRIDDVSDTDYREEDAQQSEDDGDEASADERGEGAEQTRTETSELAAETVFDQAENEISEPHHNEELDPGESSTSISENANGRSPIKKAKAPRPKSRWHKRADESDEQKSESELQHEAGLFCKSLTETTSHYQNDKGSKSDNYEPTDTEDQHALGDTFTRISRLARKQEGTEVGDLEANLDAFRWYISNGDELFSEGRFEDAEKDYIRALELIGTLDVPTIDEEFKVLQNLGDIYLFLDQPDKAVELYECTKEDRFTSKVPASKYIAALIKLGATQEEKNCFNDAERQYRKAVEVAAEHLEKDDPILVRLNQACLDLARNRSTLMSRFSSTEVERIRVLAKQEAEVAIMHRKKKTTEAEIVQPELWKGGSKPTDDLPVVAPPSSKQRWLIASGVIGVIFIFAFATFLPHGTVPAPSSGASDESIGNYSTVDGLKQIDLGSSGHAYYSHEGKTQDATYSFVGNTIQDLIPLIPGHMRTAFAFFNSKNDTITDANGTRYYQDKAPELQLVKQMWKYATIAQGYRNEKNFYPERDDQWTISKDKLTFLNPITHARDQAVIYSTMNESTDSPIRKSIADGELWKDQPVPGPGRITCNVFNSRMFFIRGYDRDGKVLTSSKPNTCFYIECSDGLDITKEDLAKPPEEKKGAEAEKASAPPSNKKLRFIFASNPETEANFTLMLSAIPGALFCLMAATLAMWRYRVNKKVAGPFSLTAFVLSALLLLAWLVVGVLQV